jgi:uncharacterized protein (TIGR00255 family)
MLLSMTGFGRASMSHGEKTIICEIRALNAKVTDLKIKLPADLKEREMELRKQVTDHVERGKIDLLLEVQSPEGPAIGGVNEALFRAYFHQINRLTQDLGIKNADPLQAILRIPNVVAQPTSEISDGDWEVLKKTLGIALNNLQNFRKDEGKILEADIRKRVLIIRQLLEDIKPLEAKRFERVREKLRGGLVEFMNKESATVDESRFEQEILFYLEKMDINEEKTRLEQHCNYFFEQLDSKTSTAIGRTLGFISQEMGREINTLGAKAYEAEIQRFVVQMKDELEKIKEQLANVL